VPLLAPACRHMSQWGGCSSQSLDVVRIQLLQVWQQGLDLVLVTRVLGLQQNAGWKGDTASDQDEGGSTQCMRR
jgi:hypothetical protein